MFILTARAPEAQEAIYEFMKGIGLEIPAENIIGLGNSTAKAKADWIANNLILAGYNNIYFADDARANVEAVKDMFALFYVNSVVEIANADLIANGESRFSEIIEEGEKDLSGDLNIIVEDQSVQYICCSLVNGGLPLWQQKNNFRKISDREDAFALNRYHNSKTH